MINNKGFTLVELIVVVTIIGILASIAVPIVNNFTLKAQGTEAIAMLGRMSTAMRLYYMEYNTLDGFNNAEWATVMNDGKYYGPQFGWYAEFGGGLLGYTLKVYGKPGTPSEGQWVVMMSDGRIKASYNGDEPILIPNEH